MSEIIQYPKDEVIRYDPNVGPSELVRSLPHYSRVEKGTGLPGCEKHLEWRRKLYRSCRDSKKLREQVREWFREDMLFFLNSAAWLYEPRVSQGPTIRPFNTWPHQDEAIAHLEKYMGRRTIGIEKSRGEGASWLVLMTFLHQWLFYDLRTFGIVSKDEKTANDHTNPDSLTFKFMWQLEIMGKYMPWLLPRGWDRKKYFSSTKGSVVNPQNNSTINAYSATGCAGTGGRKAQPLDAKILTPFGWIEMGQIEVGDVVTGADGRATVVKGVYPQGLKQVFRVTFSDGSSTECCDEHLWKTDSGVKSLHEIANGNFARTTIPIVQPLRFFRHERFPLDPYLLGCLIGDGSFAAVSPRFTTADEELIERLSPELPEGLSFVHKVGYDYTISSGVKGKRNELKESLIWLGLYGKHSHDKFVPDLYKFGDIQGRLELLRGLMDTDGHVCLRKAKTPSSKVTFCSCSERLANDVMFLVQSLGGTARKTSKVPTYTHNGEKKEGRRAYEICINMPPGMNPFKLARKAEKYVERTKYFPRRSFKSIEFVGVKECQCIEVMAEDSLYVTDDCIVTHNTAVMMDELAKFPRGDDDDVMASMQPVTDCRILVSTPFGDSGAYYDAMHTKGTQMLKIILHWPMNPTRNRGLYQWMENEEKPRLLDDNFDYKDTYEYVQDGRLRSPWYDRQASEPDMIADPRKMAQEYDLNYGGSTVKFYDATLRNRIEPLVKEPWARGEIDYDSFGSVGKWEEVHGGKTRLWLGLGMGAGEGKPAAGKYVLGVDVSAGTGGTSSSNSAIVALNVDTGEQVLEWVDSLTRPAECAQQAVAICKWLSIGGEYPLLVWESNGGYGKYFTEEVSDRLRYPHLYVQQDKTKIRKKRTKSLGYRTNNRRDVHEKIRKFLSSGRATIRSRHLFDELNQFEYTGDKVEHNGSLLKEDGATGKAHGDIVVALGMAIIGLEHLNGGAKIEPDDSHVDTRKIPANSMGARLREREKRERESKRDLINW